MRFVLPASGTIALVSMTGVVAILALHSKQTPPPILITLTPPPTVLAPDAASTTPQWDREHRSQLIELKSNADAFAIAGQLDASKSVYQQIIDLVGNHEITDPVVEGVFTGSKENLARIAQLFIVVERPAAAAVAIAQPMGAPPSTMPIPSTPLVTIQSDPTSAPSANQDASSQSDPIKPKSPPVEPLFNATAPPVTSQSTSTGSDLDGGSNLPDPKPNPLWQRPSGQDQTQLPSTPVTGSRSVHPPGGPGSAHGVWSATWNGPANESVDITLNGKPYTLGGPNHPRTISGTGTGPITGVIVKINK